VTQKVSCKKVELAIKVYMRGYYVYNEAAIDE